MSDSDDGGSRIEQRCRMLLHRLDRHYVDIRAGYPQARSATDLMALFETFDVGEAEPADWVEAAGLDASQIGVVDFSDSQIDYISFAVAVGHCVQAMKHSRNGDHELAWEAVADASFNAGSLLDSLGNAELSITGWCLLEPERDDGLQAPLYETLKRAKEEGRRRPTAKQVINEWMKSKPPQVIEVLPDEVKFIDSSPTGQGTADLEALRKRIGRMTDAKRTLRASPGR